MLSEETKQKLFELNQRRRALEWEVNENDSAVIQLISPFLKTDDDCSEAIKHVHSERVVEAIIRLEFNLKYGFTQPA